MNGFRSSASSRTGKILAASAAALAATALYNTYRTRKAEREHPPAGRFVTVDGVRLHYIERGQGSPVVLVHGNVVIAEDFVYSGVFDRLTANHRVIAFDRPGYGYSERPQGSMWTARQQADLLAKAFDALGIEHPVVVGHSWGTLVALELALGHPGSVSGLVLLAGYYQTTFRADVALVAAPAVPVFGDVLRHTLSPLIGSALMPLNLKAMFAPLPVPERFEREFPHYFPVRPGQIRAESQDAVTMVPAVIGMEERARDLKIPVAIMAGTDDKVVDPEDHSVWLHGVIPDSDLRLVPGVGHMLHHAVPGQVAEAIDQVAGGRKRPSSANPIPDLIATSS
ncbi:alpha/beta hydrolase [Skermanella stibiiresistens SB22]|uniref:Alpha/beta hydrolase n=1 Tax=Skermanella stibiiresistens SB22 TaxID=1385369 RepID=W9GWL2_9PROT|nr:alpha/beta hydrolase [Skermanella stibiiresistens]EWY37036.1 alpha/beta hydrolase [Skermanella stibiiresistens SB22]